jgi:hypothetical protein
LNKFRESQPKTDERVASAPFNKRAKLSDDHGEGGEGGGHDDVSPFGSGGMSMAQLQAMQQMMTLQMASGGANNVDPAQLQHFLQLQGNQAEGTSQLFQSDSSSRNAGV